MKTLLLFLSCVALAASTFAQTSGQFELRRYNTGGGMTSFWITPENSKAFGLNGSGVPAMIAVGGSSTLAGLSDVAISGQADLDLLQYNAGTGKYSNIPGSTYLTLAAGNAAYQPLASALTTLSSATAAGLALMDDASAAAQRTTLGLGTISTQASSSVSITGGTMSGLTVVSTRALTITPSSGTNPKITFNNNTTSGSAVIEYAGSNTNVTYLLRDQATGGTLISTGDTSTVTDSMLAGSITPSKITGTAAILGANTFTGAQTINSGTLTASTPSLQTSQTWNNAAVQFFGVKQAVSQTAYSAGIGTESWMHAWYGGAAGADLKAGIDYNGGMMATAYGLSNNPSSGGSWHGMGVGDGPMFYSNGAPVGTFGTFTSGYEFRLMVRSDTSIGFSPSGSLAYTSPDALFYRDGAAAIQMGYDHATTPTNQTFKAHDVTTGTGAKLTLKGGTGSVANGAVVLDGGNRASNVTDASTSHALTGFDTVSQAVTESSLNDLASKINDIKAALISHGLMAP